MKRGFQTLDRAFALTNHFQESEPYIQMQHGEKKIQGPTNTVKIQGHGHRANLEGIDCLANKKINTTAT